MKIRDWDVNLKIRLGGELTFNIVFWTFFPYLSIYFSDAFGKGLTGALLIASQVASVIIGLFGGYCADRFGRKRMMVAAAIGQAIGYGIFALAASPWLAMPGLGFAAFTFASLSGTFYWPASQATVADLVDEREQQNVFAVFYSSTNIAVVIGPILGSLLYMDHPAAVLAAVAAVCAGLALLLGQKTRETMPREKADGANQPASGSLWNVLLAQLRDYRVIASDRVFLLFILAGVLLAQTYLQLDLMFPLFMKDTVSVATAYHIGAASLKMNGEQLFGVIVSENGLLVALFTVVVTKWMTGWRDRFIFVTGALVYAASIAMFGQMTSFWGFVAAMAVFTLAELMSAGPQQSFVSRLAPEHMRGQYFAASSVRYTLGRSLAPLSIPLAAWAGYGWTFAVLAVLAVLGAILYNIMFNKFENNMPKAEASTLGA